MLLRAIPLFALSCSLAAQIYSNGPLITNPTGGFAGGPVSILQSNPPTGTPPGLSHTVFGYGAQQAAGNSCADDFATNGPWIVDGIEVFGYLTGGTAASVTDVRLQIYSGGAPGSGGVPLVDSNGNSLPGLAVNLFTNPVPAGTTVGVTSVSNTLTGIYRAQDISPLANNRNIQSIRVNITPALILPSGIYWLQFQYNGASFCPPVSTTGVNSTGNAIQNIANAATWAPLLNGTGGVAMPFNLYGTQTTAPGAITNLGGGCDTASFRVEGSPAVGGYVIGDLTNLNPLMVPLIAADLATSGGLPWPGCGCLIHFTSSWVPFFQSQAVIQIPMDLNLVGIDLYMQGGQVDFLSVAPCVIGTGLNFGLTDGYQVHLW